MKKSELLQRKATSVHIEGIHHLTIMSLEAVDDTGSRAGRRTEIPDLDGEEELRDDPGNSIHRTRSTGIYTVLLANSIGLDHI